MWRTRSREQPPHPPPPLTSQAALGLLALAVVVLGCAPNLLLGTLVEAVRVAVR